MVLKKACNKQLQKQWKVIRCAAQGSRKAGFGTAAAADGKTLWLGFWWQQKKMKKPEEEREREAALKFNLLPRFFPFPWIPETASTSTIASAF